MTDDDTFVYDDDNYGDPRCEICRRFLDWDEVVRYQLVGEDSGTFCRSCQEELESSHEAT